MPLTDVNVLNGSWESNPDDPVIILSSALAREALAQGELHQIVIDCLGALELSGKKLVYVGIDENAS